MQRALANETMAAAYCGCGKSPATRQSRCANALRCNASRRSSEKYGRSSGVCGKSEKQECPELANRKRVDAIGFRFGLPESFAHPQNVCRNFRTSRFDRAQYTRNSPPQHSANLGYLRTHRLSYTAAVVGKVLRAGITYCSRTIMKPGIYVHLPFCAVHCVYCDFPITTQLSQAELYYPALLKEIAMHPPQEPSDTL